MLGLVTIGQSPREDIVNSMFGQRDLELLIEAGALDGLGDADIAGFAPQCDEDVLVTRLRDGREVLVGKESISASLQQAVDRVVEQGATLVCVLCTGAFPTLISGAPLVFPDRLMPGALGGMFHGTTIGIVMPHENQAAAMKAKWGTAARNVVTETYSPYTGDAGLEQVVRNLRDSGAEALVMDCMGYDRTMAEEARLISGMTVVLANGLVGAVLRELAGISLDSGNQTH